MKRIPLLTLILIFGLLAGACQAAPDMNRPWNTATPQMAAEGTGGGEVQVTAVASVATPTVKPVNTNSGTVVNMAGAADNPPFLYADDAGNPTGLFSILYPAIFERMGMQLDLQVYPWNRALAMATDGEAPLAGIYKNDERMKIFDYSEPVYPNAIMVYVRKGETFDFSGPADLAGKSVGIMSGWTYGDEFDSAKANGDFLTEEVSIDADNLKKLTLGRLDCVLAESTIAHQIINEQGYSDLIEELPVPLIVFDTYLVFPKTMNETELINTFNQTLSEMQADGSFDKLVRAWSGEDTTDSSSTAVNDYAGLVLDMAGAADNPPFLYADDAGNPTGLFATLYPAIFDRMDVQLNLQVYPWNRALAMATDGEAPLAGIYKNDERMKIFDYSDPVYPNAIMVYVRKGETFDFSGPADLAGKSVGIMSGWTYGDEFDSAKANGDFLTEEVSIDADNLKKLTLGRVDCVLAESTIAHQIIAEQGYTDQLEELPVPLIVFDTYLVFPKTLNQMDLINAFNQTLAAMKEDGSFDKLVSDWNGEE